MMLRVWMLLLSLWLWQKSFIFWRSLERKTYVTKEPLNSPFPLISFPLTHMSLDSLFRSCLLFSLLSLSWLPGWKWRIGVVKARQCWAMIYLDPKGLWLLSHPFCLERQETREIWGGGMGRGGVSRMGGERDRRKNLRKEEEKKACNTGAVKTASFLDITYLSTVEERGRNKAIQKRRSKGKWRNP